MSEQTDRSKRKGSKSTLFIAIGAALIAAAAIYVINGQNGNDQTAGQDATSPAASTGLAKGQVKNFVYAEQRQPTPTLIFADDTGAERSLKQWQGKTVLLNLWATWCAPCRKEMPGLSSLQSELGGENFEVVALSVDRKGLAASQKFLNSIDAKQLALYVDESAKTLEKLKVIGLPTTLLIDKQGNEVGRLTGPAEWDTHEAMALIRSVINEK
jgi:thiol-disulfide isomerase/thioredoxin